MECQNEVKPQEYLGVSNQIGKQKVQEGMVNLEADQERWLPVLGYEGLYSVSSLGRVRSDVNRVGFPNDYIHTQVPLPNGYLRVFLSKRGRTKTLYVHRLVSFAFLNIEVNHKDGNKQNNRADNLELVTSRQNKKHAHKNGYYNNIIGENSYRSLTTEKVVRKIRKEYIPYIVTQKQLAKKYSLKEGTIHAIIARITWKHI